MTATPETTAARAGGKEHLLLAGLAQQGGYAYRFAKAGRTEEALEHLAAIERLIAAYRAALHVERPGVVGNELTVQWLDSEWGWRDHGSSIPGLFLEDGKRLVERARTAEPARTFRLARRLRIEETAEISEAESAGGGE